MVSISGEAPQVNTVDASLGNAISNRPITQLPFEARNVVELYLQRAMTIAAARSMGIRVIRATCCWMAWT